MTAHLLRGHTAIVSRGLVASLALASSLGCSTAAPGGAGTPLQIAVAPLTLAGIEDACYSLAVSNAAGDPVWSKTNLCSSVFGNGTGGDISYVGTCDATDPGTGAWNTVTLKIDGLYGWTGAPGTPPPPALGGWVNPCAAPYAPDGCELRTLCVENQDAPVSFNLTIMREANQGFFDIAVNFEDIFCSAKVDCTDALVHDPATGKRVDSIVLGFACTDGDPGATDATATHLYMNDLVIRCGGATYAVNPSDGPGNLYPDGVGAPDPLVQAMTFVGVEQITNQGVNADKLFWNAALGIDQAWFDALPDGTVCTLETRATASHGPLTSGLTPPNTLYPYIDVNVTLFSGGAFVCSEHPLDGDAPHDGVTTSYTGYLPDHTGFAPVSFGNEGTNTGPTVDTHPVAGYVDPCLAITCGEFAHCEPAPVAGCFCDDGYDGDPTLGCELAADCGNGEIEGGEICDDGGDNGLVDCEYGDDMCVRCTNACTPVAGVAHLCGDGTQDPEESCDDGASNGQPNFCDSFCMGTTVAECDNGTVEDGEDCDAGPLVNGQLDCDYGETECERCSATCQFVPGDTHVCGDGNHDLGFELCDDGSQNGEPLLCDDTCTGITLGHCDNGIIEAGEDCDGDPYINGQLDCGYGETSCDRCSATCQLVIGIVHVCGDGIWDTTNEDCDDGSLLNGTPNHCNEFCSGDTAAVCGNAILEAGEGCDEGVGINGNLACNYGELGCLRCGFGCTEENGDTQLCGDGAINEPFENCDDGDGMNGQPNQCNLTCSDTTTAFCGNGEEEAGEICDDGPMNGQALQCDTSCMGTTPAVCGNDIEEDGEICDEGPMNGEPLHCSLQCMGMTPAFCGNYVQELGEACDEGTIINGTPNFCNADCTGITTPFCGNGAQEAGELCDDGPNNGQPNFCDSTCSSMNTAICGNSIIELGEGCDQGIENGDLDCQYGVFDCARCTDACQPTPGIAHYCGDNSLDPGEICDATNFNDPCGCQSNCEYATQATLCGQPPTGACDALDQCDGMGMCNLQLIPAGFLCRVAVDADCDVPEFCSGFEPDCPADQAMPEGTACGPQPGPNDACDEPSTCTGLTGAVATCTRNYKDVGTICATATLPCELDAVCDGVTSQCNPTGVAGTNVECRRSAGECDAVDYCDGINRECPNDDSVPDGTMCVTCDATACVCEAGTCADVLEWQPQAELSELDVDLYSADPRGDVDTAGNAVAIWTDDGGVAHARSYDASTDSWDDEQDIATDVSGPVFALGENTGDGVFAWYAGNEVKVATYLNGAWNAAQTVATCAIPGLVQHLSIDIAPTGDGVLAYDCIDAPASHSFALRITPQLGFSSPAEMALNHNARNPEVAVEVVGSLMYVTAAWQQFNGSNYDVAASTLLVLLSNPGIGAFNASGVLLASYPGLDALHVEVARAAGREAVVWSRGTQEVLAATQVAPGFWSAAMSVSGNEAGSEPFVGVDALGNTMVAWNRTSFQTVTTKRLKADNVWESGITVGYYNPSLSSPLVFSSGADGGVTVGWGNGDSLYVVDYTPDVGWTATPHEIEQHDPEIAESLFIARGDAGLGLALWNRVSADLTTMTLFSSLRK